MLEFLPELRELELVRSQLGMFPMPADVSGLKHLETFVYRGTDIWQIPTLPESLRHLNLSGNPSLRFRPERDYIPPNLESLSIQENPRMGNDELLSMLAATAETKSLRSLDIGRCPKIDADSLDWLVVSGLVENLEVLSLQGNLRFGDQVTKELGRMVKLRRLNVGSTRISGVGVSNLVHRKESRLEWLGLDYCPNVGVDATGIVKSMGVEVSCKVDKSFVKEKKLRYTIGL